MYVIVPTICPFLCVCQAFDSARKIRCMLRPQGARRVNEKVVSYAFNVDTLHQKEVTFETDEDVSKANAVLDIQVSRNGQSRE